MSDSFKSTLRSMFHNRITYPKDETEVDSNSSKKGKDKTKVGTNGNGRSNKSTKLASDASSRIS